jgi:hypothetical protein
MQQLKLIALIIVIVILQTIPATISTSAQPSGDQCVQAIQKDYFNVNIAAITLNMQTGQASFSAGPVIPLDANYSPDGKYAVFWQQSKPDKAALYIANVSTGQATLLYETDRTAWPPYPSPQLWAWAPDSSTFAYIQITTEYSILNIVSADGQNRQKASIVPEANSNSSYYGPELYGFSADSAFIAVGTQYPLWTEYDKPPHRQVRIWSAKSLSPIATILSSGGYRDEVSPAAWSPRGHQLALALDTGDKSPSRLGDLAIWSPEKDIETRLEVEFYNDYYRVLWSPNGKMIWLNDFYGHGQGANNLYYVREGKIVGDNEAFTVGSIRRIFLGWSGEESAIVVNFRQHEAALILLNVRTGAQEIIDRGSSYSDEYFVPSPDGKRIAYVLGEGSKEKGVKYHAVVVDVNGNNKRIFFEISYAPDRSISLYRSIDLFWSPDSRFVTLRWVKSRDADPGIFTIVTNADGSVTHKLPTEQLTWIHELWAFYEIDTENGTTMQLMNVETGQRFDLFSLSDKINSDGETR